MLVDARREEDGETKRVARWKREKDAIPEQRRGRDGRNRRCKRARVYARARARQCKHYASRRALEMGNG